MGTAVSQLRIVKVPDLAEEVGQPLSGGVGTIWGIGDWCGSKRVPVRFSGQHQKEECEWEWRFQKCCARV